MFGRKDCLYIATLGKEGERPDKTAYAFPNTGHYIMRSDWGEDGKKYTDARWLLLRAGTFGSHGHWDLNSIVLYAYGRQLLIDPGRTTYGTPLMYELTEPKSHNVLLVDDHKQQQPVSPQINLWSSSPMMDIADCTYKGLYPGVDHRRAVVFVRPDYYILFDEAISDKAHKYGVNFWLTPPDLTIDKSGFKVCTNEPDGSNIVIKLADSDGAEIVERKGTMDVAGGIREDIPVITFIKNSERASFTTILYPFPKLAEMDKVDAKTHNLGNGQVCVITTPANIDYVCYARQPELCSGAGVAFYGSAAIVRTTDGKNATSCAIVNGNMLKFNDIELISSEKPVKNASVRYTSDTVIIDIEGNESGIISIAALGRTKALVNGSAQAVQNGIVKIIY